MAIRVGINGFGRIGRSVLHRALATKKIKVVAVNDITDPATLAHLFKYDSVMGTYPKDVGIKGGNLVAGSSKIKVFAERNPADLPWDKLNVDIVIDSTGLFLSPAKASMHLKAGAKKVILSAPSKESDAEELKKFGYSKKSVDGTFVLGVNDNVYDPKKHHIISNASCTTNCLAPVAKVLDDNFQIKNGLMTTIHAYTSDQRLLDAPHKDLRRARAAAMSMIPTKTGAAKAIGLVLPKLNGKLDGMAVRVPTANVSLVDLTVNLGKAATADDVNKAMKKASEGALKGILGYAPAPMVSVDFTGDSHSSIFDPGFTKMIGKKTLKVLSWYDNEWGYSCRLVDLAAMVGAKL